MGSGPFHLRTGADRVPEQFEEFREGRVGTHASQSRNASIIFSTSAPSGYRTGHVQPGVDILADLGPALVGGARRGDQLHDVVGNELRRGDDLVVRGGPRQHLPDLVEQRARHAGRLHDVRLLAEVLRHEQAGGVEGGGAVVVHRAHDELRAVDVVDVDGRPWPHRPPARRPQSSLYAGDTR